MKLIGSIQESGHEKEIIITNKLIRKSGLFDRILSFLAEMGCCPDKVVFLPGFTDENIEYFRIMINNYRLILISLDVEKDVFEIEKDETINKIWKKMRKNGRIQILVAKSINENQFQQ